MLLYTAALKPSTTIGTLSKQIEQSIRNSTPIQGLSDLTIRVLRDPVKDLINVPLPERAVSLIPLSVGRVLVTDTGATEPLNDRYRVRIKAEEVVIDWLDGTNARFDFVLDADDNNTALLYVRGSKKAAELTPSETEFEKHLLTASSVSFRKGYFERCGTLGSFRKTKSSVTIKVGSKWLNRCLVSGGACQRL